VQVLCLLKRKELNIMLFQRLNQIKRTQNQNSKTFLAIGYAIKQKLINLLWV
jgi:hypothetical protein